MNIGIERKKTETQVYVLNYIYIFLLLSCMFTRFWEEQRQFVEADGDEEEDNNDTTDES